MAKKSEIEIKQNNAMRSKTFESAWSQIYHDKKMIARLLMRTIYYASGLPEQEKQAPWPQPANAELINWVLLNARFYEIKLDLNEIPYQAIDQKNKNNALMHAIIINDLKSVINLLDYDSSKRILDFKNSEGDTAFILSIKLGFFEIADLFIERKLDFIPETEILYIRLEHLIATDKNTFAGLAAKNGDMAAIELLMKRDAPLTIDSKETGMTPTGIAVANGHFNIAAYILMNIHEENQIPIESITVANLEQLTQQVIQLINAMESPEKKIDQYQKILGHENAFGKLLTNTAPKIPSSLQGMLLTQNPLPSPNYLDKIKNELAILISTNPVRRHLI